MCLVPTIAQGRNTLKEQVTALEPLMRVYILTGNNEQGTISLLF